MLLCVNSPHSSLENMPVWSWGNSSESTPCQHEELSFVPRSLLKSRLWWHTFVETDLGRQRTVDPEGLLAGQTNLVSQQQMSERDCLSEQGGWS